MPKEYEAIRDSLVARGVNYDKAQSIAAGKYNERHPGHPLIGHRKKKKHESMMSHAYGK